MIRKEKITAVQFDLKGKYDSVQFRTITAPKGFGLSFPSKAASSIDQKQSLVQKLKLQKGKKN